jgi:hypothetical protein
MGQAELLISGLLVVVAGLSALARHLSVPYPIVLDHPRQPHRRRLDVRRVMINYHGR